jgi:hypothetical protein
MSVYTIFDITAQEFGPLFECVNDSVARRQFDHFLKKMDEADRDDFALCRVGEFDRVSGILLGTDNIKLSKEDKNGTGL